MAGKIIGGIMIIAACMGFGYRLSIKHVLRKEELTTVRDTLSNILSNLEYGRMTFEEALAETVRDEGAKEIFSPALISLKNGNSIKTAWKFALESCCRDTYMTDGDIESIIRMGEGVSSGDLLLQKTYADNLIKYIDKEIEGISGRMADNSKLCRSVSITIGIFIVVLLI